MLHELSPQSGSLEDAFLKATADAQEYRSARPVVIDAMRSEWIKLSTVTDDWVLASIAVAFPLSS